MKTYDICYPGQDLSFNYKPSYCDSIDIRIPNFKLNKREVWPSKMFTIKLELNEFQKSNPTIPVYDASQGDGGMSLGGIPREEIARAIVEYLPTDRATKYGDPIGNEMIRKAIYENYYHFDSDTGLTPDNIIMGDGGRDVLQKWYQAIQQSIGKYGDNIMVSAAPWGSYLEGPYVNGFNLICAPGDPDFAFKITCDSIDETVEFSNRENKEVVGLIITTPDNPTGNYIFTNDLIELIEHAVEKGIQFVFVDLMYQAVTDPDVGCYDVNRIYKTLLPEARKKVCFMDGLTKKAGASNLRNAHLVCGSGDIVKKIKGIATHTVIPNAVGEAVAWDIYSKKEPLKHPWVQRVIVPTAESRKIVRKRFKELGYKYICDQGYYAFVNIYPWLGKKVPEDKILNDFSGKKIDVINDVEILKSYLASCCGLAVIHGTVFRQPHFIRFSYANSPEYTDAAITRLQESLGALI